MTRHLLRRLLRFGSAAALAGLTAALAPARAGAQVPDSAAFSRTFQHRTAAVNGVRLHYVVGGRGRPVLLLHGFPETWYAWRHVMPGLARAHTVIVPDLRGAGASDKPPSGYDKRTMAEDLHQLVAALGYTRLDVVGHDVGVGVAYAYAAAHRGEVAHLVLLDVPPQGTRAFAALAAQSWVFPFHQQRDLAEALVAGRERAYFEAGFYRPMAYNPDAFTPADVDEYVRAYAAPGALRAAFEWYRAFDTDTRDNAESLKTPLPMPVLALGGAQSGGPTMAAVAREVAADPHAGVVDSCGHWMLDERPRAVLERLTAFLDGRR